MEMDALGVKGSVPGRRRRWCGGVGSAAQKKYNDYTEGGHLGAQVSAFFTVSYQNGGVVHGAMHVRSTSNIHSLISGIEKFLENKLKELLRSIGFHGSQK